MGLTEQKLEYLYVNIAEMAMNRIACMRRFNDNLKSWIDGASFLFGQYWIMSLSPHPAPIFI